MSTSSPPRVDVAAARRDGLERVPDRETWMQINFFGDVCLHEIDPASFSIDPDLVTLARSSPCNVANLECPLTLATGRRPYKHVHLKAPPVVNPILDFFHVFTLANNHILDYQAAGLRDTIRFLDGAGKKYFGAGENRRRSFEPLRIEVHRHKLGFVGFSQWHTATRGKPGGTPPKLRALSRQIRQLAGEGRFVVAYGHWNYEYIDFPAPANRRVAHRLVDAGAHLVVGSHPHVVQGYEEYKGRYIFHSLGNFVFNSYRYPDKDDTRINETFVLSIELDESLRYDFSLTPVLTDAHRLSIARDAEAGRLLRRIEDISEPLRDPRRYESSFYAQAAGGANRISTEIRGMVKKQGIMYLLSRLHRVTLQDLKIKFYSAVHR
jgi:hypothetical protein